MEKLNINWHSNAPWANTGYGCQTRINAPRIRDLGYPISITSFFGLQGSSIKYDGITVYPLGKHPYGQDIIGAHALHAGANAVITLMDAWVVQPENIKMNWYPWFPIDCEPMPRTVFEKVKLATKGIAMSKFGQRMCEQVGLDVYYVPHSIDTKLFKRNDMTAARKKLGFPQDKFIIGMVAANKGNPPRKSFFEQIAAFAALKQAHKDVMLYLHTDNGINNAGDKADLVAYCSILGLKVGYVDCRPLPDDIDVAFVDQYQNLLGIPDEYMVDVYNALDVMMLASLGEGFGIPLIEAQACGCPVITGAWTAMEELVFSGWKIPKEEAVPVYQDYYKAFQWRVDEKAMLQRLLMAYDMRGNEEYRKAARQGALAYDADKVLEKYWKPVLADIEKNMNETAEAKEQNQWAAVGLINKDRTISVPALNNNDELISETGKVIKDGFKQLPGLQFVKDNDGVTNIIQREIMESYQLDGLEIGEGDFIIDIGAHRGIVSCYLAKQYPQATILAYEPEPKNYQALLDNRELNQAWNIKAYNLAVTGDGRPVHILADEMNSGSGSIYKPTGEVVESVTMAQIFEQNSIGRVALLKIDCEGAEYEILPATPLEKINAIRGEIHASNGNPAELMKLVQSKIKDTVMVVAQ